MASINDTKAASGRRSDPWEVQIIREAIERRRVPPLVLFMRREQERQAK